MVQLLNEVDHPWCSHIVDTGQYPGSRSLYRLRSGKEEWLDYDRIFRILRGVKYNGFVSLVYEGWKDMDDMHAVPVGVKFLRSLLSPQSG